MKMFRRLHFMWMEALGYSLWVSCIDNATGLEVKLLKWLGPFYMKDFTTQYPKAVFISKQWTL